MTRLTINLERLIVLSESSLLGWFLHALLMAIIKGRSPMEVSLIGGFTKTSRTGGSSPSSSYLNTGLHFDAYEI
jgi:hypothetical protein